MIIFFTLFFCSLFATRVGEVRNSVQYQGMTSMELLRIIFARLTVGSFLIY